MSEANQLVKRNGFLVAIKHKKIISYPKAIDTYNQYMDGMDLLDSTLQYYKTNIKSKKYCMKICFHILNLCMVNS